MYTTECSNEWERGCRWQQHANSCHLVYYVRAHKFLVPSAQRWIHYPRAPKWRNFLHSALQKRIWHFCATLKRFKSLKSATQSLSHASTNSLRNFSLLMRHHEKSSLKCAWKNLLFSTYFWVKLTIMYQWSFSEVYLWEIYINYVLPFKILSKTYKLKKIYICTMIFTFVHTLLLVNTLCHYLQTLCTFITST